MYNKIIAGLSFATVAFSLMLSFAYIAVTAMVPMGLLQTALVPESYVELRTPATVAFLSPEQKAQQVVEAQQKALEKKEQIALSEVLQADIAPVAYEPAAEEKGHEVELQKPAVIPAVAVARVVEVVQNDAPEENPLPTVEVDEVASDAVGAEEDIAVVEEEQEEQMRLFSAGGSNTQEQPTTLAEQEQEVQEDVVEIAEAVDSKVINDVVYDELAILAEELTLMAGNFEEGSKREWQSNKAASNLNFALSQLNPGVTEMGCSEATAATVNSFREFVKTFGDICSDICDEIPREEVYTPIGDIFGKPFETMTDTEIRVELKQVRYKCG